MPDCLIIGDSLAVGIAQHRPDCVAMATTGITSVGWRARYGIRMPSASTVLISLGTNDSPGMPTERLLMELRRAFPPRTIVYWLVPPTRNPAAQEAVRNVARWHGDQLVPVPAGPDGIHPTRQGYADLARVP
jgi:hypothetical protein